MRDHGFPVRPVLRTRTKLALAGTLSRAVVLGRRAMGRSAVTVARRGGLWWELDLTEGIDLSIYLLGGFERANARVYGGLVRPGDLVLDIGANIGAHTLPLARCAAPGGSVIAFEATSYAFAKLQRNLTLNSELARTVTAIHAVLIGPRSDSTLARGQQVFSSWPLSPGSADHPLHGGRAMSTDGAETTTVDSALRDRGVNHIDFIKIDTDGHEVEILEGAAQTLRRSAPSILIEVAPYALAEAGRSVEELLTTLDGFGYRLHEPRTGAPLDLDGAALSAGIPDGASIDLVAKRVEQGR